MRKAFVRKMMEFAADDPSVILVTGDLGFNFFEEYSQRFPEQFLNVGICEQSMAGICAGLAMTGRKVFMYSIGNFPTLRCLEQIRNDICYHDLPVFIVSNGGGMAYGYLGMSHHGTEDISVMRSLPGITVCAPADPLEVEALMDFIYRKGKPAFLRMNRGGEPVLYHQMPDIEKPVFLEQYSNPEADTVLIATGEIGNLLEDIRKKLENADIVVDTFTCPVVKPLPQLPSDWFNKRIKMIVTLEENNAVGGLGSALAEELSGRISHPALLRIGMPDAYCSVVGKQNTLRDFYGLSPEKVAGRIIRAKAELL